MCRLLTTVLVSFLCLCPATSAVIAEGVWLDVPFVRQEKNACGAAAIAMVMNYWLGQQGRPQTEAVDAAAIQRALYVPGSRGIYASAMEGYFQHHGYRAFSFRGEWSDLQQHLEKGRPLIVAVKPSGADADLHYVVVTGIDSEQGFVMLNDPARRKLLKQDRTAFEKQWSATGKWTLLALPPAAP